MNNIKLFIASTLTAMVILVLMAAGMNAIVQLDKHRIEAARNDARCDALHKIHEGILTQEAVAHTQWAESTRKEDWRHVELQWRGIQEVQFDVEDAAKDCYWMWD